MKARIEALGLSSRNLDVIVRDAAENQAIYANSEGMKAQLEYLNLNGYSDSDIWKAVVLDNVSKDMTVVVSEPSSEYSSHLEAFTGVVTDFDDETVIVKNNQGESFDVDYVDIASWQTTDVNGLQH